MSIVDLIDDEFDYWKDAFEEDPETVDNIPFLFSDDCATYDEIDDIDDIDGIHDDDDPVDYSIRECITLQNPPLRKYSYENRFYFVTTFLLREKVVDHVSINSLIDIDHEKLQLVQKVLKEKYTIILSNNPAYRKITDEYGNTITAYVCALESSFKYPMSLCRTALGRYWQCAHDFHTRKILTLVMEERLEENRPKNHR